MRLLPYIIVLCVSAASCKKKAEPEPEAPPVEITAPPKPSAEFKCGSLPPSPEPFGWSDTTTDVNKNVTAFFSNPLNGEELIVVVQGDAFGFNKMLNYNQRTKSTRLLAALDGFLPSVNLKGWIAFSGADNNIYKIKANGDSLTKLTQQNVAHDAKWDGSGNFIYFLQDAHNNVPAQLIKANPKGVPVTSIPHAEPYTAPLKKTDRIVLQRNEGSHVQLVLRDNVSSTEIMLVSKDRIAGGTVPYFRNLCADPTDEYVYWSDEGGIMKCNLLTKKTDTVFKTCGNMIYDRPLMSPKNPELTFSLHTIRPVAPYQLLHEFKATEYNLNTREVREIRIFN